MKLFIRLKILSIILTTFLVIAITFAMIITTIVIVEEIEDQFSVVEDVITSVNGMFSWIKHGFASLSPNKLFEDRFEEAHHQHLLSLEAQYDVPWAIIAAIQDYENRHSDVFWATAIAMRLSELNVDKNPELVLGYLKGLIAEDMLFESAYFYTEEELTRISQGYEWYGDVIVNKAKSYIDTSQFMTYESVGHPVENFVGIVTSCFGRRNLSIPPGATRNHLGIDIAHWGNPYIVAAHDGVVIKSTTQYRNGRITGYGHYVVISDPTRGISTVYAHLKERSWLKEGDRVIMGERIGIMGMSGTASGDHVHFEYYIDGVAVDPYSYIYAPNGLGGKVCR